MSRSSFKIRSGFRNYLPLSTRSPSIRSSSMQAAGRRISFSSSSSCIPRCQRVITGRSDDELRSKRYFAAPALSESSKEKRFGKRRSKEERRTRLEEFVDRYRASNDGKFPTVSHARQQLGGSHYTVRQIIQELQYNQKMSPRETEKPVVVETRTADVFESGTADTGEDAAVNGGEARGLFEVRLPLVSSGSEKNLVEEPINSSMNEIIHSNERFVEHTVNLPDYQTDKASLDKDSPSGLDDHTDKESLDKDSPSGLADENHMDNAHDSAKFQADSSAPPMMESEIDILHTSVNDIQGTREEKTSFASVEGEGEQRSNEEADSSEPLVLESEVDILHTPDDDIQGTKDEKTSFVSVEGEREQRSDDEVSKSADLASDNSIALKEDASSPKVSIIWGNLRSLANGIIDLWKKM